MPLGLRGGGEVKKGQRSTQRWFLHYSNRNLKHILVTDRSSTLPPLPLSEQKLISDQYLAGSGRNQEGWWKPDLGTLVSSQPQSLQGEENLIIVAIDRGIDCFI